MYPEFAKKYVKWHWDHHQINQNANFGITLPLFDYILKTRKQN
jgi:sterol desaturase/sphingolipid hydroxylase (fatty acid hydroxylase superfamily)